MSGAVCALRWVAVVLLQEQQVARVLGFVLHVNRGLAGTSADSQESPVIALSLFG